MNTAWEIIKKIITKDKEPGSFGYAVAVNQGADIFVALLPLLKNKEEETKSFNADHDVEKAILQRTAIKELKEAGIL